MPEPSLANRRAARFFDKVLPAANTALPEWLDASLPPSRSQSRPISHRGVPPPFPYLT